MSEIEDVHYAVTDGIDRLPHEDARAACLYVMLGRELIQDAAESENPGLAAIVSSLVTVERHLTAAQAHLAVGDTHLIDYSQQLGFQAVSGVSAHTITAFAGKNILSSNDTDRFDYTTVHEIFENVLRTLPAQCTIEDFQHLCDEAEALTSRVLDRYSGMSKHLFRYYGTEMLPRIFPAIQRYTFSVESQGDEMTIANGDDTLQKLPTTVHGINTEELIGVAGMVVQAALRGTTHIKAADGNCSTRSWQAMNALLGYYPQLAEHMEGVQFETSSRRETAADRHRTGLVPVAASHTLYGITYTGAEGTGMMLCFDPTIAQVDRTEAYDIEVTALPLSDLPSYMRLRYRTYPDIPIGSTINPSQYAARFGQ